MWHRPNFPFCGGANRCTGAPLSSARSVEPIEGGYPAFRSLRPTCGVDPGVRARVPALPAAAQWNSFVANRRVRRVAVRRPFGHQTMALLKQNRRDDTQPRPCPHGWGRRDVPLGWRKWGARCRSDRARAHLKIGASERCGVRPQPVASSPNE
jgi:hypothetical protein